MERCLLMEASRPRGGADKKFNSRTNAVEDRSGGIWGC